MRFKAIVLSALGIYRQNVSRPTKAGDPDLSCKQKYLFFFITYSKSKV